jgi:hypothetical protein
MKNFVAAVAVALAIPFAAVAAPQTTAPHQGVAVAIAVPHAALAVPQTASVSTPASPHASANGDVVYGGADNTDVVYGGADNTSVVYGQ